jgi:hypothetical protein
MPPGFAGDLTRHLEGTLPKNNPSYKHYVEHNDFYKTLFTLKNVGLDWANRFNLLMTLKHLPNMAVSLTGFKHIEESFKVSDLLESTETFLNFKPKLFDISNDEYANGVDYWDFHAVFKGECRNCHLSRTNNQILANQLYDCITAKSINPFDVTKFKKNFIDLNNIIDNLELETELGWGYTQCMKELDKLRKRRFM